MLTVRDQSRIGYSDITREKWWPKECTARERTNHAQDSSWLLSELIENLTINGLLAEFQFAYLTFVVGQVTRGFYLSGFYRVYRF